MSDAKAQLKFERLYGDYHRMVRNVLYNMTGAEHLDDLTQEAFLKIWKGLPRFAFRSSIKTWVYRVSVNTAIDHLKKRALRLTSLDDSLAAPEIETSAVNEKALNDALKQIDEMHRSVIVLYYFEELKIEEISKILELPVGTVKSRLNRAREKLKTILARNGELHEIAR
jgi:RNA polymerase sigma-70 factor, ECF subfamily